MAIADAYVDLHVDGDHVGTETRSALKKAAPGVEKDADRIGKSIGSKMGKSLSKSLVSILLPSFGQIKFGGLLTAGTAIAGLVPQALSLAGALTDVAGAAAIIPGALLAAGAAGATLAVGFKGVGEAFKNMGDPEKLLKALENLAPAAQETVLAFKALGPAAHDIRMDVQQKLFEGLAAVVKDLGTNVLPVLKVGMGQVASAAGGMLASVGKAITSSAVTTDLKSIFSDTAVSITPFGNALNSLIPAFTEIAKVGASFLPDLAWGFANASKTFGAFIDRVSASGQLKEFIDTGLNALSDLANIALEAGKAIFGILKAAQAAGGGTLATLSAGLSQVATVINSPAFQTGLTEFFKGLMAGAQGVFSALPAIGSAIAAIAPVIGNLAATIGPLLGQALAGIAQAVEALAPAFNAFVNAAGPIVSQIFGGLATIIPQVASAIGPLLVVLGKELMGALTALAPVFLQLAQVVIGAVKAFSPLIAQLVSAFVPVFVQIINTLLPPLLDLFNSLVPIVGAALSAFVGFAPILSTIAGAVGEALAAFAPLVTQLVGALVPVILQIVKTLLPPLIGLFNTLVPVVVSLLQAFMPLIEALAGALVPIAAALVPVIEAVSQVIGTLAEALVPLIAQFVQQLVPVFQQIITAILPVITPLLQIFVAVIEALLPIITALAQAILPIFLNNLQAIIPIISAVVPLIQALVPVITLVANVISAVVVPAIKILGTVVQSVFGFILNIVTSVISGVVGFVTSQIRGMSSFWSGVWNGIKAVVSGVISAIKGVVSGGINAVIGFVRGVSTVITIVRDAFEKARLAVGEKITGILTFARELPGKIVSALGNVGNLLFSAGADIIRGMLNGLSSMVGAAVNKAREIAGNIVGGVKDFLGIGSPSKVFKELGQFTVQGFIVGLQKSKASAVDTMNSLFAALRKAGEKGAVKALSATAAKLKVINLAGNLEKVKKTVEEASGKLKDAIDAYHNTYNTMFEGLRKSSAFGGGKKTFDSIVKTLTDAVTKTKEFGTAMSQLRTLGLNETAIAQLSEAGLGGLEAAKALVASGKAGITQVNDLQKQLDTAAGGAAKTVAEALNRSNITAAQTYLKTLQNKQNGLETQMKKAAVAMLSVVASAVNSTKGGLTVPKYATGTTFHPGGPAVVAERGPELINLPRGSSVTPMSKMGPSMVNHHYDVRLQVNVDQLAQMKKIDSFLAMLDRARIDNRRTYRSGQVTN